MVAASRVSRSGEWWPFGAGAGSLPVLDPLQPGLLPEQQAGGLAAAVSAAVAAQAGEVDGVVHPSNKAVAGAGLVGSHRDAEGAAAVLQHLGHERHPVERAVRVERGSDLDRRADADQLTGPEAEGLWLRAETAA